MTNKLSVEQRIQKDHVWLMKNPKYCLYSGIMMLGKTDSMHQRAGHMVWP